MNEKRFSTGYGYSLDGRAKAWQGVSEWEPPERGAAVPSGSNYWNCRWIGWTILNAQPNCATHLEDCPSCQQLFDTQRAAVQLLTADDEELAGTLAEAAVLGAERRGASRRGKAKKKLIAACSTPLEKFSSQACLPAPPTEDAAAWDLVLHFERPKGDATADWAIILTLESTAKPGEGNLGEDLRRFDGCQVELCLHESTTGTDWDFSAVLAWHDDGRSYSDRQFVAVAHPSLIDEVELTLEPLGQV